MKIQNYDYLNEVIDVSEQFATLGNIHFSAQSLEDFDPEKGRGRIRYARYERKGRMSFNLFNTPFERSKSWNFPPAYKDAPEYPLELTAVAENVIRIRSTVRPLKTLPEKDAESLMLDGVPGKHAWKIKQTDENFVIYQTEAFELELHCRPFQIILRDNQGRELTRTLHEHDSMCLQNFHPMPFSYVHSAKDMHKYPAVSLEIHPAEHFYGCGESFTKLDKYGQKISLWTRDPHGTETAVMYKPIPFYISSRGYGVFYHTSAPLTLDFGNTYAQAQTAYMGDENIDIFIFVGNPKEILAAYTDLTGRSPLPPLWSFGLWMSRITYKSEDETRQVASDLQKYRIPCDVIHLDTGWFEKDWQCNFKFSTSRFKDPKKMIADLKKSGYRISLWQIPYFTPVNEFFEELETENLAVKDADGFLPTEDAIMDLSNPQTIQWYTEKLNGLFDLGVSAIKADFGEAAPLSGVYASGASGFTEHNLYPLRYNKAVFEATEHATGEGVIWARSAWAGSQRYPLHWGGDCENNDMGMLASLRGGLSLGACGFSFWSHDVGGFVKSSPEDLYERWTFMGIFTSHMRCHGAPPKEPWAYSDAFLKSFRHMLELRYQLMPYIMAQSVRCSEQGLPLLRAMFIECPEDETCQGVEDQYFFGDHILVAPLFEKERTRSVYLPAGKWVELGSNKVYAGERRYEVTASVYPGLAFVRSGAVLPLADPALTTDALDWNSVSCVLFGERDEKIKNYTYCPERKEAVLIEGNETVSSDTREW